MESYRFCPLCGSDLETRSIENRERRACTSPQCEFVFWDNPVPVVAAIVEHDAKIILARNREWPPKMFGLVTGLLEKQETPGQGVLREVEEELGLRGEIVSLVGLYPFFERNQVLLVYHVKADGTVKLGDELAEIIEVEFEKVRPWPFGTGLAVKDWLEQRGIKT